jgi:hypothetical protein
MATWILDDYGQGHLVSRPPVNRSVRDCEEEDMQPPTEEQLKSDYDKQWLYCIGADDL